MSAESVADIADFHDCYCTCVALESDLHSLN